jgi:hypothetical protein
MSFQKSLAMGQIGETLFYLAHEGKLEQLDGFKSDFVLLETGQGVELKTDYWDFNKTPNFFIERYSNMNEKSPGGPWQAQKNGSDLFCYFYVKNMTFYKFETTPLVNALEEIIKTLPATNVSNKTYVTQGYRVPRSLLSHLSEEYTLKVTMEKKK